MKFRKVCLKTSARLHFNSLKMNSVGNRGCGGVGLALNEPVLELHFYPADKIIVNGGDNYLRDKTNFFANNILKALKIKSGIRIEIKKMFPNHIGLGSGTQLGLIVGKGISLLYNKKNSLEKIANINKRAGISGIGFYSFMLGGLIVDGGYRMGKNEEKKTFGDHASHPPPLVGRYKFPKNWKILLIMPHTSLNKSNGMDEASIFMKNTPIPVPEVDAICANTLMGLIPSLLEKNYFEFIENLFDIIRLGTKKIELELNRKKIAEITHLLNDLLIFKWRRIKKNNYILFIDELQKTTKQIQYCFDPKKRYEFKREFIFNEKKILQDKIPFLGVSSLGPSMYSILLEGHHRIDYLLKKVRSKLGKNWDVRIVNAQNNPAFFKVK